ncbi:TrmH family RNA methyltransferase [Mariniplasma anaerobium]|uniref:rRNA methyltransferase n=1 Tax=Mariniplasma anaerobium TaxID=2735436 RepID=A0A7U9THH5_9MOLU|nr:RNA methyltransferase [Mariniplasma anaerobium]BCR36561.1 rRNA methyltransferase [Mariniplasma anaerobium]
MIISKQNKQFKLWKKLMTKKYRDLHDMFLVYGKHLVDKARDKGALIEVVTSNLEIEGTLVSTELMDELQQTETYIDLIGVCKKTNDKLESNNILVLDDVQDPDNVGALIRSAAAFGFKHIIMSHKTADLYNEKVIRASKGAIFDCYIERSQLLLRLTELKDQGYQIVGADAHETGEPQKNKKLALVLGNEGHGLSDSIKDICDEFVTIKTNEVESLNVSVAGGILMHEWRFMI